MISLPIIEEFKELYLEKIDLGKSFLNDKKICITGLCRNVSSCIEKNIDTLNLLSDNCTKLSYFIYENDSSDNTVQELSNIQNKIHNFHYLSEQLSLPSFGQVKDKSRIEALCRHRQICQTKIIESFSDYDYIIVTDLDFKFISIDGILNSFGWLSNSDYDAMAGNSFEYKHTLNRDQKNLWNYDSWAFRGNWWIDLHHYYKDFRFDPMVWFGFVQPLIGSTPSIVNSAFGGMCIYPFDLYKIGTYDHYDCEHVCFHKSLWINNKRFKLGLNQSQFMFFD
jgi:hypothetical protein